MNKKEQYSKFKQMEILGEIDDEKELLTKLHFILRSNGLYYKVFQRYESLLHKFTGMFVTKRAILTWK